MADLLKLEATVQIVRKCSLCGDSDPRYRGLTGKVDGRCRQCGRLYPDGAIEAEDANADAQPCGHGWEFRQEWDVTCPECNACGESRTPGMVTEAIPLAELLAAFWEWDGGAA